MASLEQAIQHQQQGDYPAAEAILLQLLMSNPADAAANYHMAWTCDAQGKEAEAVPYYEAAIAKGLDGEDLRGALLGLGSTYRCLGRYAEAVRTLRKGLAAFPEAREFPVFLAMALYNIGQHQEAMALLLHNLVQTTASEDIQRFQNAILFYHDKLDQTW